jgi:hypothetical protein
MAMVYCRLLRIVCRRGKHAVANPMDAAPDAGLRSRAGLPLAVEKAAR